MLSVVGLIVVYVYESERETVDEALIIREDKLYESETGLTELAVSDRDTPDTK